MMLGHGFLPVACVFLLLTALAALFARGLRPGTAAVPA